MRKSQIDGDRSVVWPLRVCGGVVMINGRSDSGPPRKISLQLMFPSNTGRMISVVAEENCFTTLELLLLVTDMTNEGCLN